MTIEQNLNAQGFNNAYNDTYENIVVIYCMPIV